MKTSTNRQFINKEHEMAFWNGYESKSLEIKEMGWNASRDKFNMDYTPGKAWEGTSLGLSFSKGEFAALEDLK